MPSTPELVSRMAFAETLTTRLCHDMAGLIATLSGTIELVAEDPGADAEATALAAEAARVLAVRLRLYRAAWGGGDLEQASLSGLAEGLPNRARLSLDLAALEGGALDEAAARLVLCLLLAASAGLPAGGTVRGALATPGIRIELTGRRAAWPAGLRDGADGVLGNAAELAAPMAHLVATSMGWRLEADGASMIARPG